MTETAEFIRAIELATGKPGRRRGRNTRLVCPAHEDHNPSLDVADGSDGRPLTVCRSHGCTYEAISAAIGWRGSNGHCGEPETVYDYIDEKGDLLYQVVRFPGKKFLQRRPDGKGGWIWNLEGVRRVLYRLPLVESARKYGYPVYVGRARRTWTR